MVNLVHLSGPPGELGKETRGVDLFPSEGDGAGRAPGVPVGDAPLVVGCLDHTLGVVEEEQAYGTGAHSAAIADGRRRGSCLVPRYASHQPLGGLLGAPPATDDPLSPVQVGHQLVEEGVLGGHPKFVSDQGATTFSRP
jgi:hypothetical protein